MLRRSLAGASRLSEGGFEPVDERDRAMTRRRLVRSLGVTSLALSCGCSLLFGLDGLDDGGSDAGNDTGTSDTMLGGDAVALDAPGASADAWVADATGASEGGPRADGADGQGTGADATSDADASMSGDADASTTSDSSSTGDAGPIADAGIDASSLDSGLVLHLPFDETSGSIAYDTSGNGNDATLMGGATFSAGIIGNAVMLNGANQYVELTQGVTDGLTAFSITAWVHLNPAPDAALANWSRIFDLGTGTSTYAFLVPDNGSDGNLRFSITTAGNQNEQRIEGPTPLPTGMWEHVAVTSVAGVGSLYVDGAQVAQNAAMTLTLASLGTTTQNWLGRSPFPGDPYLAAQIDDLRLYSRALNPSEVALLYTQH